MGMQIRIDQNIPENDTVGDTGVLDLHITNYLSIQMVQLLIGIPCPGGLVCCPFQYGGDSVVVGFLFSL